MSVAPAGVTNVLVAVSGVLQDPSTYGVVGNTITFSAAPPSGTGNISCRYLGVPVTGVTTTAYRTQTEFTATANQTTFTPPSYTVGFIDVYRNGALLGSADFTATNGTTVVLTNAASEGDLIETISFLVSSVLNAIPNTAGSVGSSNIANGVTINFADGSASTPSITNDGDTNTGIFFPAADTIAFSEGGVEAARFDSAGNLGIGTTSPTTYGATTKLAVVSTGTAATWLVGGTSGGAYAYFSNNAQSSTANTMQIGQGWATGSDNIGFLNTNGANPLLFATNGAERMRITSGGYTKISNDGTYNSSTSTAHEIRQSVSNNVGLLISCSNTSFTSDALDIYVNRATTNSSYYLITAGVLGVATRFLVADSGNVANSNNSYGAISDIKVKENIVDASPKLDKLNQVRIVNYNLKNETQKQIGVIAQELETIFPSMVDEMPDRDKEGNDLGTKTKSVKYSVFVPMLIKAMQEQQAMITELKATVDAQAARIAALEGATE
jgi:hypothetical protein